MSKLLTNFSCSKISQINDALRGRNLGLTISFCGRVCNFDHQGVSLALGNHPLLLPAKELWSLSSQQPQDQVRRPRAAPQRAHAHRAHRQAQRRRALQHGEEQRARPGQGAQHQGRRRQEARKEGRRRRCRLRGSRRGRQKEVSSPLWSADGAPAPPADLVPTH